MTVSILQTAAVAGFANTATFGAGVTLGNWLVITGGAYSATIPPGNSASPTIGGIAPAGASQLLQEPSAGSTDTVYGAMWLLPVTGAIAGGTAVAFPFTSGSPVGVVAYESTGWTGTPSLDRSSPGSGTGAAVSSGTTPAIRYQPELIVGWTEIYGEGQSGGPSGYTNTDGSGGSGFFYVGYQVAATSGGTYVFADTAVGSANWCAGIVTLGVASAPSLVPPLVSQRSGLL